ERYLVPAAHELAAQLVDDALGAAVRARRHALQWRRHLGDAKAWCAAHDGMRPDRPGGWWCTEGSPLGDGVGDRLPRGGCADQRPRIRYGSPCRGRATSRGRTLASQGRDAGAEDAPAVRGTARV